MGKKRKNSNYFSVKKDYIKYSIGHLVYSDIFQMICIFKIFPFLFAVLDAIKGNNFDNYQS